MTRMPPARLVRLVAVLSLLAAGVACVLTGWGAVPWWAVLVLAGAVAVSEVAVVHLQFGRQRWTFSLTEAALGAALVVTPGAWTVLAVGLGVVIAQHVRHQPRLKREFNVAQFMLATAAGQSVAGLLGGSVAGACAGMAAFWLVNYVLVAVAVSLTSQRPFRSLVISSAPLSALHTAGNTSIGLLAAYLGMTAPLGLLGLVVPLALLWSSYDQQTRRSAEARLFAELARGQERETNRSSDVSAQVVVTAAARLLGGADVELVLLAADGPVRYVGDETGVPDRRRVGSDVFDEPWVLRALGNRGVTAGRETGRPYVSAVLGDPDAPLAVLRAQRGADAASFERNELRLAEVLVGQAESWLSVADLAARSQAAAERAELAGDAARALSDLGSATAPALLVLRESTDRLARLAESAGGVDDIVEELHLVERAVASLLGAIALAAEPDLLATAEAPLPARPTADWTTTGVLR
jgi:membrane protein YdbS with pleckstrin-like domain